MSHEGEVSEKCQVIFEWPLTKKIQFAEIFREREREKGCFENGNKNNLNFKFLNKMLFCLKPELYHRSVANSLLSVSLF